MEKNIETNIAWVQVEPKSFSIASGHAHELLYFYHIFIGIYELFFYQIMR